METIAITQPYVVTPYSPYLNSSREIANKRFVLAPHVANTIGFPTATMGQEPFGPNDPTRPYTAFGMITLPPGSKNIRIVDCEFEGPWDSILDVPDVGPGSARYLRGIEMHHCHGIRIEGCTFNRMPREAIYFYGCQGIEISDVWARNCRNLIQADWIGTHRNRFISIDRAHFADGWEATDLVANPTYASIYDQRRGIGTNAVNGWFADSTISRLTTSGEVKSALKLINPVRVTVDQSDLVSLMIQGTTAWDHTGGRGAHNLPGFDESLGDHGLDTTIKNSTIRQDASAWAATRARSAIQLSYRQERTRFENCVIHRPGPRYFGAQVWDGVDATFVDNQFIGWESDSNSIIQIGNYAKPGSLPATINADWREVNRFM